MTKKDYILIAKAIKTARENKHNEREELGAIDSVVSEIMKVFTEDNPLFNSTRFQEAIYK